MQTFQILGWSEIKSEFVPTAHPHFNSPSEAREYAKKNIKTIETLVQPV